MKNMALIVLCLFSWISAAKAAIPDNDMSIPPMRVKDFEMISEHEFNSVLQILYKIYAPVIKEKSGLEFIMSADWKDGTVNAFATREPESWTVHINGGIARAKGMTTDSLALIVCHEIGHHLGGAPRTFLYEGWPSAEGQADYWASSKCMKNYYAVLADDEVRIDANVVPQKIITDCTSVYKNLPDLKICVRTQTANLDFARFLNSLPDAKAPVTLDSKDDRVVKGTNTNDYPRAQCRFDTLYQGALCDVGSHVATSETDAKIGHCNDTTKPGTRPRCWYKPKD